MNIKHLVIDAEESISDLPEIYLIRNTSNNVYIRLGKNETYYLLFILGETEKAKVLKLEGINEIPSKLKEQLKNKFEEWGFLNEEKREIKRSFLEKIKKIRLVKFDVEKILKYIYPIYSKFFSKKGFIFLLTTILLVIGYFTYALIVFPNGTNIEEIKFELSVGKIILILIFILLNTFLHEFAHAVTCVKYGGAVTTMGILLFYLIPCFYCDVSSVYTIKNRKKRAIVGISGILINLFVGNLVLILAITLSYFNIIQITLYYLGLSLILLGIYNLIPFVKLDGYWILSALTGIDNLMDKSIIIAYVNFFSRKDKNKIGMSNLKRNLISLYGIIALFFNGIFWCYTIITVKKFFEFNEYLSKTVVALGLAIILIDFIKTIQYYYKTIKKDYNRILMMI